MGPPSTSRQAITVARYELWKLIKGWRLILLIILVTIFSILIAKGLGRAECAVWFARSFFTVVAFFLIPVVGVVFGGDVLASEFDRKTGHMLFSNPMRRATVVAGKFVACFISVVIMILICYSIGIASMLNLYGEVPPTVLGSFGLAILYGCATLSLTFFFSSILGGMSATIISFFTLFMIMPFLQLALLQLMIEPWCLLTYTSKTISAYIDPPAQRIVTIPGGTIYVYPDFTISVLVMMAYILVSLILCTIATKRREMR
jgi:ABC-type transport system involved in multi-copper enzyme maturation permease subunit